MVAGRIGFRRRGHAQPRRHLRAQAADAARLDSAALLLEVSPIRWPELGRTAGLWRSGMCWVMPEMSLCSDEK